MKKYLTLSILSMGLVLFVGVPALAQNRSQSQNRRGDQERPSVVQENTEAPRERVQRIRQNAEQRRAEVRQEVCERRQERLQNVIPRLNQSSTTLLSTFDMIYERVQGFYESGQLTVANYDELAANVDAAQTDATAAVAAVTEFEFELDCDNPNVGEQLDGFRQAVREAREDLKTYRGELVELIRSLRAEAAETRNGDTDTSDGSEDEVNEEEENEE